MDRQQWIDQGHIRLASCRYGPMLYLATDQCVGQSLDRYGEYSEDEADLLRMIIEPGWTILELGANIGAHTVFLAKTTGPTGFVLAFEPQRVVFQILCANVALNALSNVYTYQAAVGREEAKLTVPCFDYTVERNYAHVALGSWPEGDVVPQMTVDSLELPSCHLIKINVEGMEGEAIAGAEQTIERFRPVLYVENDREDRSAAMISQLFTLGYRLYWHMPPLFNPRNFLGATDDIFGGRYSGNMLGIHATVEQQIEGLREITEPGDRWLWDRTPKPPETPDEAER